MKILSIFAIIFFFCTLAFAAGPYLVSDPNSDATGYVISGDLTADGSTQPDGSIKHDLQGIAEGQYNIEVKFKNMYGESAATSYQFEKKIPESVVNLRVVAE